MKSSLRWCFLFSRCLIYNVLIFVSHLPLRLNALACGAWLSYHTRFRLSTSFFKFFSVLTAFPCLFCWLAFPRGQPPHRSSLIILPHSASLVNTFFQKPFGINRVLLLSSVPVRFVPPPLRDSLVRLPHSPSLVNTFFHPFSIFRPLHCICTVCFPFLLSFMCKPPILCFAF